MDHLQRLRRDTRVYIAVLLLLENMIAIGSWWIFHGVLQMTTVLASALAVVVGLGLIVCVSALVSNYVLQPMQAIWQSVLHLSPNEHGVAAPGAVDLKLGRELVASVVAQIHQMANVANE